MRNTLLSLLVLAAGCGSSPLATPLTTSTTATPGSSTFVLTTTSAIPQTTTTYGHGLVGDHDITEAILTNTSPDCADYNVTLRATVIDLTRQVMFNSGVSLETGGTTCTLTSNNIPNHNFNDASAHFVTDVSEQSQVFELIRDPQRSSQLNALTQATYDGVLLNGVPIDLLSAGCYRPDDPMANHEGIVPIGCAATEPWLANPLGTEDSFGADTHNAHTQPDGTYHYHGNPEALFDDQPGPDGSPVIGFAADGFPIYGSYFLDSATGQVRKALSSYVLKSGQRPGGSENPSGIYDGTYYDDYQFSDQAGDLDQCNGMVVNGQYGYYVTDAFPYLMFCLWGTVDASFDKNQGGGVPGGEVEEPAGFAEAAATLGVTLAELQAALGPPPPNLEAAASTLGVTVAELQAALPPPP